VEIVPVRDKTKERWSKLCERAAKEQDPEKLKLLNREIDRLLLDEHDSLKRRVINPLRSTRLKHGH
jgi:hypothetical protein